MKSQLFIPKKCKVGFNLRQDTYTGKLGYIIYHDGKVWRKETSWESWREKYADEESLRVKKIEVFNQQVIQQTDYFNRLVEQVKNGSYSNNEWYKKTANDGLEAFLKQYNLHDIEKYPYRDGKNISDKGVIPVEFENVPTEGFVLNKKVGGYHGGWDARQTYCRVWDPRGFEFEITIPNLLFILQETNSIKGKGLEGEFVYSWDGKDLVLIPTTCKEYTSSSAFTELQGGKVAAKDLVGGYAYKFKNGEILTYLGKFEYIDTPDYNESVYIEKKFIFVDNKENFIGYTSIANVAKATNETVISNFAELIDKFSKSDHYGAVKSVSLNKQTFSRDSNTRSHYYNNNNDSIYAILYKEETPNVYRRYYLYAETRDSGYDNYHTKYYTTGFKLKAISELKVVDGRLVVRKLSEPKSEAAVPLDLINQVGYGDISLTLNSGKKVNLN